jgi:hypothetical protein
MDSTDRDDAFLRLLSDVCDVSRDVGSRSWVWGGLAVDVLRGGLLRDHHDLDCFALDLTEHQGRMIDRFRDLGYEITVLEEFQILRIDRDAVERLRRFLVTDGFGDLRFLRDVTSFTSFWAGRGYPEYAEPIRIA